MEYVSYNLSSLDLYIISSVQMISLDLYIISSVQMIEIRWSISKFDGKFVRLSRLWNWYFKEQVE